MGLFQATASQRRLRTTYGTTLIRCVLSASLEYPCPHVCVTKSVVLLSLVLVGITLGRNHNCFQPFSHSEGMMQPRKRSLYCSLYVVQTTFPDCGASSFKKHINELDFMTHFLALRVGDFHTLFIVYLTHCFIPLPWTIMFIVFTPCLSITLLTVSYHRNVPSCLSFSHLVHCLPCSLFRTNAMDRQMNRVHQRRRTYNHITDIILNYAAWAAHKAMGDTKGR